MPQEYHVRVPKAKMPRTGTINTVLRSKSDAAVEAFYNAEVFGSPYHYDPDNIAPEVDPDEPIDQKPF